MAQLVDGLPLQMLLGYQMQKLQWVQSFNDATFNYFWTFESP